MRAGIAIGAVVIAGCWGPEAPPVTPPPPATVQRQPLSADEQEAVEAATEMLKKCGVEYGDFESIKLSADKKSYWIEYPTKPEELKVLGSRAVTVEIGTWKANLVMRD